MIFVCLFFMGAVCFLLLSIRVTPMGGRGKKAVYHLLFMLVGSTAGALFLESWHGAVVGGVMGFVGGILLFKKLQAKLIEKRKEQLSGSFLMLSNLLAAGFGLPQAMATVTRETPPPLKREWERVMGHVELGANLPHALALAARRLKEEELALAAIALGIQERKGGSMTKMLAQTAATIRQRSRLAGRVRILTAQGRMTAIIVMVLPFALLIFQRALAPQLWQSFFQSEQGPRLLLFAAVLQLIGSWWVFKLSTPNS